MGGASIATVQALFLAMMKCKCLRIQKKGVCQGKRLESGVTQKNHEIGDSALEIKTSSVEGRFKTTNKKFDLHKVLYMGVFDPDYGVCKPKVRVSYKRDYYKIHDVRLTIDRQIEYTKLDSRGVGIYRNYDTDIIVEVKAGDFIPIEYLMRKFHFDRVRIFQ